MRRIDFTDVFPEDIEVVLPDRVLLFPGDIDVEDTVELTRAADALESTPSVEAAKHLADTLLRHFQRRQPDLEKLPIPPQLLLSFIYELYLGDSDDDATDPQGADEATSTTKKKPGSRKPAAKRAAAKTTKP